LHNGLVNSALHLMVLNYSVFIYTTPRLNEAAGGHQISSPQKLLYFVEWSLFETLVWLLRKSNSYISRNSCSSDYLLRRYVWNGKANHHCTNPLWIDWQVSLPSRGRGRRPLPESRGNSSWNDILLDEFASEL